MAEQEPPGFPMQPSWVESYGLEEHHRRVGSGVNLLRTDRFAQPQALMVGDKLATGETIISEPREGGNGSVLIHVERYSNGHDVWIGVPSRIALALETPEDKTE